MGPRPRAPARPARWPVAVTSTSTRYDARMPDHELLAELIELGLEDESDAAKVFVTDYPNHDTPPPLDPKVYADDYPFKFELVFGSKRRPVTRAIAEQFVKRGANSDSPALVR